MENKSTSSQLPTALRLVNTVTTNKSTKIENFEKHFSTAVLASSYIKIADVLKELQNLDPYKSAGLDNLNPLFLKLSAVIVATPITSLFKLFHIVWDP